MANYLLTCLRFCNFVNLSKGRNMNRIVIMMAVLLVSGVAPVKAQSRTLTLEDCREMAVASSKTLDQARTQVEMASYDRKIALANYFPEISATGAYLYNNRDIALISEDGSARLRGMGTLLQDAMWQTAEESVGVIGQAFLEELRASGRLPEIAGPVNAIGEEIDASLHPDIHNLLGGTITVKQPVFVGGKIIYSNQMAAYAADLAASKYDMAYADVITDVDQAYWQIVSIAGKKRLAESYADLVHALEEDVNASVAAGVMTASDALQIKVKSNEAQMSRTKATNGLQLAKMLLCKRVGLPLDTAITLADENLDVIPQPAAASGKSLEDIFADRPETRSLELAGKIFDRKAKVVRADMMPTVALLGNFAVTNPNSYNGFQHTWQGGMLSAGVMVKVPIFHGFEALNKYKKAQAEARLYSDQYEDAKQLINLQVTQQRHLMDEALQKVEAALANLDSAEENLRTATAGFEAGVIPTHTVLGAQTAWLSAHSDYIDAGIELQMAWTALQKAEGNYKSDLDSQ